MKEYDEYDEYAESDFEEIFDNIDSNINIYCTADEHILAIYKNEEFEYYYDMTKMLDEQMGLKSQKDEEIKEEIVEKFKDANLNQERLKEVVEKYLIFRKNVFKNVSGELKLYFNKDVASNEYVNLLKLLSYDELKDDIKLYLWRFIEKEIHNWYVDYLLEVYFPNYPYTFENGGA